MTHKHTPKDWYVYEIDFPNGKRIQVKNAATNPHGVVCLLKNNGGNKYANARLIAAAPELLEALELALPFLPEGGGPHSEALQAIAKARGQE